MSEELYVAVVNVGTGATAERYRTVFDDLESAEQFVDLILERKFEAATTEWSSRFDEGGDPDLANLDTVKEDVYGAIRRTTPKSSVEEALEHWNREDLLKEAGVA